MDNYKNIKPYRELRLTTPFMHGDDVRRVQKTLKIKIDGEYGPVTASAVVRWKHRAGYPSSHVHYTMLGKTGQEYLFGIRRVPASFRVRMVARARAAKKAASAKPLRVKALNVMLTWANNNVKERPSGSNKVPELQTMSRNLKLSSFYVNMGWPWCAHAVMLAMLHNGSKAAAYGLRQGKFNALYTPDILYNAQRNRYGMRIVGASQAQPGDLVMINFPGGDNRVDHVGMVVKTPSNGWVETVEGNTSSSGSQDNGGAVLRKNRPLSIVSAFIRYE